MRPTSRILIALASMGLLFTCLLPFWFINLTAPQYPEGLTMKIWLNKITGDVDIINGLNHYIGMKHINQSMFPEFHYLGYAVAGLTLLGLAVALIGKRQLLLVLTGIFVSAGIAAIYDFYKWGYDYGHNLDPRAPIQVPGLSYQPPVIGHKSLLNFDAYSYPDAGAWITIAVTCTFFVIWVLEYRKSHQHKKQVASPGRMIRKTTGAVAACIMLSFFSSCTVNPEAFSLGKDNCSFCKMTIVSPSFGGEILTKKGRVFKFDDMHCLVGFLKSGSVKQNEVLSILAVNFQSPHQFIDVPGAVFLHDANLHSPMNGNVAAFADEAAAHRVNFSGKATITNWNTVYKTITE